MAGSASARRGIQRGLTHIFNKLIDLGDGRLYSHQTDLMLHFMNEAILNGDPKLFVRNFMRYEVIPKLNGRRWRRRR